MKTAEELTRRMVPLRQVVIQKASSDVYAATIDAKIAMKVGPGDWSPTMANLQMGQREWKLVVSGHQFAVWEAIY